MYKNFFKNKKSRDGLKVMAVLILTLLSTVPNTELVKCGRSEPRRAAGVNYTLDFRDSARQEGRELPQ